MQCFKFYIAPKLSNLAVYIRKIALSLFAPLKADLPIVILSLSSLMVTIFAVIYLLYAYPMADDYYYATSAHAINPIFATINRYFMWSGRWGSSLTEYSLFHFFGLFKYYNAFLVVSFITFLISIYVFLSVILNGLFLKREIFILFLVFFSVFWSGSPAPGEHLYWFVGSVENLTPLSYALLLMSAVMRMKNTIHPSGSIIAFVPMIVFAIIAASYHELTSVLFTLIIICIYLFIRPKKNELNYAQHTLLVAYVLSTLVVLFAPGNFIRREYEAQGGIRLLNSLYLTTRQMYHCLPGWLLDIRVTSSGLLLMLVLWERLSSNVQTIFINPAWKRLSMALWPISLLVGFFLPTAALQYELPGRVLSQLYFFFVLGLYLNIYIAVSTWNYFKIAPIPTLYAGCLKVILCVILSLGIVLSGNSQLAFHDFSHGLLPKYAAEMRKFDFSIRKDVNSGNENYYFTEIKNLPWLYYKAFPKNDENYYVNEHLAKYYGLKSVRQNVN